MSAGTDTFIGQQTTTTREERSRFRLGVEAAAGGARVVTVGGELDLATVAALRGALAGAIRQGATGIVVDLSGVTFADSLAVGAILHAHRRMGSRGAVAVVLDPSSYARVIFEVVGADAIVDVVDTREAALERVAR